MLLEILLIILLVFLLTVTISVIYWWKKYGKKMFGLFGSVKDLKNKMGSTQFGEVNKINTEDLKNSMQMLKNVLGNLPKSPNKFKR